MEKKNLVMNMIVLLVTVSAMVCAALNIFVSRKMLG